MGLAEVTAKLRGVALHLGRADTGGYYCRAQPTEQMLHTWAPEKATCKKCLERYRIIKAQDNIVSDCEPEP